MFAYWLILCQRTILHWSNIFGKSKLRYFYLAQNLLKTKSPTRFLSRKKSGTWGELSCSALPAAKRFYAISEWRMASNVLPKTFRNHNNLKCDRIFRAKRQLSLIPLNRTAALPAALSNLTRPRFATGFERITYLVVGLIFSGLWARQT